MNNDFRIGEKAVYPAHGVAEVIGIEKKEINTTVCSFYVLKVLATGMQILVPKDKADQVGLRPVATTSEIEEVFDILREKDVHIDKQTWNRRYRGFMEKIKTGSLFDVAEVYRDLYRLKSSKVLSFGERKMLDNAKQLHRQGARRRLASGPRRRSSPSSRRPARSWRRSLLEFREVAVVGQTRMQVHVAKAELWSMPVDAVVNTGKLVGHHGWWDRWVAYAVKVAM